MSDDRAGADDEPLDGDIGPASTATGPGTTASGTAGTDAAEELRRYEDEREARRRGTNAVSGRIVVVVAALFLAFLTYDSVRTAAAAHSKGDDWIYPPAVIAGICAIALLTLLTWAWRRVK
ncbi:hypothetical protein [Actinomadura sp. 7K507]|uniref:hypothetical protein n=1 Tax=Actinomadura sp. 7K507 TaxID=2530365 RepID=UPI0010495417|nr:hypothetical protein [Actinomadura sp. 7K507]TDC85479.1 hypothetical protein E1285_25175 [Actinomadura sp. 7K507]